MSLSINLSTYGAELKDTYSRIVKGDPQINWALYTYDKGGIDLKVQGTGSGGLAELEDEFSDGKIQYAFVRVTDPNTELPKFVFVNWCGAGVPESKKGLLHSHIQDIGKFLKGYHVQVNAREESDVDPGHIMKKVRDSSGSKYSVHHESGTKFNSPSEPVKGAYKPVQIPDIAAMQRSVPQEKITPVGTNYVPVKVDMAALKASPQQKPPTTSFYSPQDSKTSTIKSPAKDNDWDADDKDGRPITSPTLSPSIASRAAAFGGSSLGPDDSDSVVRSSINSHRAELEALRSGKLGQKQQQPESVGPVGTSYQPVSLPKPRPLASRFPVQTTTTSEHVPRKSSVSGPSLWEQRQKQAALEAADDTTSSSAVEEQVEDLKAEQEAEQERIRLQQLRLQEAEDEKKRQAHERETSQKSEQEAMERQREEEERRQLAEEEAIIDRQEREEEEQVRHATGQNSRKYDEEADVASHAIHPEHVIADEDDHPISKGSRAVVMFAYEAAEPNELNLIEGQIIIDIDQIDEGWWEGTDEHGQRGLFPSNYVEVQENGAIVPDVSKDVTPVEQDYVPLHEDHEPQPVTLTETHSSAMDDHLPTAIALYDYDAAEENEISFKEGNQITHIDMVSEDWWQGNVNGQEGLFPANFVELQQ